MGDHFLCEFGKISTISAADAKEARENGRAGILAWCSLDSNAKSVLYRVVAPYEFLNAGGTAGASAPVDNTAGASADNRVGVWAYTAAVDMVKTYVKSFFKKIFLRGEQNASDE